MIAVSLISALTIVISVIPVAAHAQLAVGNECVGVLRGADALQLGGVVVVFGLLDLGGFGWGGKWPTVVTITP